MDFEFSLRNDILNFSHDPLKGSSWTFWPNTVFSCQEMKLNSAVALFCGSLERGVGGAEEVWGAVGFLGQAI